MTVCGATVSANGVSMTTAVAVGLGVAVGEAVAVAISVGDGEGISVAVGVVDGASSAVSVDVTVGGFGSGSSSSSPNEQLTVATSTSTRTHRTNQLNERNSRPPSTQLSPDSTHQVTESLASLNQIASGMQVPRDHRVGRRFIASTRWFKRQTDTRKRLERIPRSAEEQEAATFIIWPEHSG